MLRARSGNSSNLRALTPLSFFSRIAIPTRAPVMGFVAGRLSPRVKASPSKYVS
jgi:hypothetical protein